MSAPNNQALEQHLHPFPLSKEAPASSPGSKGAEPPEDGIAHPRAKNGHSSGHQGGYSARPVAARRKPRISTPRLTDTSTKREKCTKELSLNKQTTKRDGAPQLELAQARRNQPCSCHCVEQLLVRTPIPSVPKAMTPVKQKLTCN